MASALFGRLTAATLKTCTRTLEKQILQSDIAMVQPVDLSNTPEGDPTTAGGFWELCKSVRGLLAVPQ